MLWWREGLLLINYIVLLTDKRYSMAHIDKMRSSKLWNFEPHFHLTNK